MIHFKDNKNKSALSTRWAQMSKQEQIIEKKKMEIQAKLEAQKQAAALAAQAKLSNPTAKEETGSANIFSNDGSFMSQYKALLDKQSREKQEKDAKEKQETDESKRIKNESKPKPVAIAKKEIHEALENYNHTSERKPERGSRDRHRRWNDRGRNRGHSPLTPVIEDRKKMHDNTNIPSLMQLSVRPPDDDSPPPGAHHQWNSHDASSNDGYDYDRQQDDSYDDQESDSGRMGSDPMSLMGPGPMGPGPMGHGPIGPGPMGPGLMGPGPMGPGPIGPGLMGPGSMGFGPMGPGPMGPGQMGPGPMPPGPMPPGPNMGPGSGSGPNMGPGSMMGPNPNMPPYNMGGPPNFPMPPNFMGPNGPCGAMPPNMCGPDVRGPGPNGPMPPFFPPFSNNQMPGPPNSICPPNSMNPSIRPNGTNFGPQPPFGPRGSNFGPNGPPNMCPPNMPFMPQGQMHHNSILSNTHSETKQLDNIPPPEPMKLQNIPPPMPMPLNHIPKPKDMKPGNIPAPPNSQVLSADAMPPPAQRVAAEVAANGDHWENVLKAIHSQDQNLWFLHNTNSNEYKAYRSLVIKLRNEGSFDRKPEVNPEDKYEPEFSLEDDDSNDHRAIKEESENSFSMQESYYNQYHNSMMKREQASSQSDEEPDSRRERRKRKKSRWGDDPPVDMKPPGVVAPMPNMPNTFPGAKLSKIDEDGLKLTNINRNNHALMQYAMTNYGTTNLNPEDWKKCEDNFKLNLLYQDMLKKRQEVERLAYAGKHKYEYDSDEDTAEGTWEHKLRSKEMNATERWATELTKQAAGKHHIGDFLPPEELKKFMEKYSAFKSGKEPDLSDYKEYKLKEDNVGFKMLQKLGWNEGQGLGAEGTGIVDPINKANQPMSNLGLGASTSDRVSADDDEFDAYRKRMMLAYRFRPNPLNNPRRPYY
ncbi:SURP and G-patch domain-containing protein 1-like isoform X1 [Maniola hyperantus]|uniref:SURP and G-patch domain-containing protein 1-like isoform X1 n=1 Tax=Aphantopus hyperantus TaxID=2795564 RepID=UPI001567E417|nr:SURP and G-patch domain-containing protein 1-like [Maniola hyperantus]